eukprot:GHVP01061243.1.p2 GENE.GHVP01061243.1~~GHVP01061243.1.p2  ORF type:complete len:130 (+),score=10.30 GHVP01061243.1:560-949(+)
MPTSVTLECKMNVFFDWMSISVPDEDDEFEEKGLAQVDDAALGILCNVWRVSIANPTGTCLLIWNEEILCYDLIIFDAFAYHINCLFLKLLDRLYFISGMRHPKELITEPEEYSVLGCSNWYLWTVLGL